jgi:hypothetical protein
LAWLRDAERPRDEEQVAAVVPVPAAASRRRLAATPERPGAREARGRLEPAGQVDPARTAGAGRLPAALGRNHARFVPEEINPETINPGEINPEEINEERIAAERAVKQRAATEQVTSGRARSGQASPEGAATARRPTIPGVPLGHPLPVDRAGRPGHRLPTVLEG